MVKAKSKLKEDSGAKPVMQDFTVVPGISRFSDYDIHLFREGNHCNVYDRLGAHVMTVDGKKGVYFAVWAPSADEVAVVGDFNYWDPAAHKLFVRWDSSGIYEGFIPGLDEGTLYKYNIRTKWTNYQVQKADPYAFFAEVPPKTASVVRELDYKWNDSAWMKTRKDKNTFKAPVSIYEVHMGSWARVAEEANRFLTYREMAHKLSKYVKDMGFTHIELMPVMEHPFGGSWGYQTTGYFAPTSRFGTPQDFMYFVDVMHQNGIGVILDWVPSHFPDDMHGLSYFDGSHLYEHQDPKKGYHPDWKSSIFNYNRNEVRSFLLSSALFWIEKYHTDGIRVDAVASMLYLDYSRKNGEWIPNEFGGNENLQAIFFIKRLNELAYSKHPDILMIAEESTAWPMVSKPTYLGGLGFGAKWNMGWMHDTLVYFSKDSIHRKFHHDQLTFALWYAFTENFMLVLSHDEVVHGKGALISKMPGDYWQRFANLRVLFGFMYAHPGKKLLFMGGEIAQWNEWWNEQSLEWHLLDFPSHKGIQKWVKDLNYLYKNEPAMYQNESHHNCFQWIDFHDWESSVISFIRKSEDGKRWVLIICNFTPVPRYNYRIGVPRWGFWKEVLNSDSAEYGGSNMGNHSGREAENIPWHWRSHSICVNFPPLSVSFFVNIEE